MMLHIEKTDNIIGPKIKFSLYEIIQQIQKGVPYMTPYIQYEYIQTLCDAINYNLSKMPYIASNVIKHFVETHKLDISYDIVYNVYATINTNDDNNQYCMLCIENLTDPDINPHWQIPLIFNEKGKGGTCILEIVAIFDDYIVDNMLVFIMICFPDLTIYNNKECCYDPIKFFDSNPLHSTKLKYAHNIYNKPMLNKCVLDRLAEKLNYCTSNLYKLTKNNNYVIDFDYIVDPGNCNIKY